MEEYKIKICYTISNYLRKKLALEEKGTSKVQIVFAELTKDEIKLLLEYNIATLNRYSHIIFPEFHINCYDGTTLRKEITDYEMYLLKCEVPFEHILTPEEAKQELMNNIQRSIDKYDNNLNLINKISILKCGMYIDIDRIAIDNKTFSIETYQNMEYIINKFPAHVIEKALELEDNYIKKLFCGMQLWIVTFGSERLKLAMEQNEHCFELYIEELVNKELPGFEYDRYNKKRFKSIHNPSLAALKKVEELREQGWNARVVECFWGDGDAYTEESVTESVVIRLTSNINCYLHTFTLHEDKN